MTEEQASKKAVELIKKQHNYLDHFQLEDKFIIERYSDEWSWFMQGWKETMESITPTQVEK